MSLLGVDSQDTICLVDAESIAIEAAFVASDGAIICVENDKGAKDTMEDNVKQFGVHNVQIIPDLSEESMAKIPTPRLSFYRCEQASRRRYPETAEEESEDAVCHLYIGVKYPVWHQATL